MVFVLGAISMWAQTVTHTISKGETFESIAQKYGITVSELKQANPRLKSCIAGFKIEIPASKSSAASTSTNTSAASTSTNTSAVSSTTTSTSAKSSTSRSSGRAAPTYTSAAVSDFQYWQDHTGKEAGKALERAAMGGYPEAMMQYGFALLSGDSAKGIKKNKKKAGEWMIKGAEAGNLDAMYYLYYYGGDKEFGSLSMSKRLDWLDRAYNAGGGNAQSEIASFYLTGKNGYPKDLAKSAALYDTAMENGLTTAHYDKLRECAGSLPGTTAQASSKAASYESSGNYIRATFWYTKAALGGDVASMMKVAKLCKEGKVSSAQSAPFEWYRKAAQAGNTKAMYELALLYKRGTGGANYDQKEALNWFKKSYEGGNNEAILNIAEAYYHGYGVTQNYNEAKKWYALAEKKNLKGGSEGIASVNRSQKAAEEKAAQARREAEVNNAYRDGLSQLASYDYHAAFANLKKAAEGGVKEAYYDLGRCYENGYGTPQDFKSAREWYKKAADSNDSRAMYIMGIFCENGIGGPANSLTASFYYGMGIGSGDPRCSNASMALKMGWRNNYVKPFSSYTPQGTPRRAAVATTTTTPSTAPAATYNPASTVSTSTSTSTYEPSKPKIERRTVTCTWCSGTGLVLRHRNCQICFYNDCVNIYCQQCAKTHCRKNTFHDKCKECGGTGTINEIQKDGGSWRRNWYNE